MHYRKGHFKRVEEKGQSKTEICTRKDCYSLRGGLGMEFEHFDHRAIVTRSLVSAKTSICLRILMHLLSQLRYLS